MGRPRCVLSSIAVKPGINFLYTGNSIAAGNVGAFGKKRKSLCLQLVREIPDNFGEGAFSVCQMLHRVFEKLSEGGGLFCVSDLFQVSEIYLLLAQKEAVLSVNLHLQSFIPVRTSAGTGRDRGFGHHPAADWHCKGRRAGGGQRILFA